MSIHLAFSQDIHGVTSINGVNPWDSKNNLDHLQAQFAGKAVAYGWNFFKARSWMPFNSCHNYVFTRRDTLHSSTDLQVCRMISGNFNDVADSVHVKLKGIAERHGCVYVVGGGRMIDMVLKTAAADTIHLRQYLHAEQVWSSDVAKHAFQDHSVSPTQKISHIDTHIYALMQKSDVIVDSDQHSYCDMLFAKQTYRQDV